MFPPEIQRCISRLQPLQAKLMEAESSSQASVAQIYEWERQCTAISEEMRVLTRQYGFPDIELGEAAGDAALRMSVLMALLRRAPDGVVSREQLLDRIAQLDGLYATAERYAPRANAFNQQMTIDYGERRAQLAVFEQNIDKFMRRETNPFAQASRQSSGGGCYIATAVYGSYEHPSVMVLRQFRDEQLLSTAPGRMFVSGYYAVSPTFARYFSSVSWLNSRARNLLDRFVEHLERKALRHSGNDWIEPVAGGETRLKEDSDRSERVLEDPFRSAEHEDLGLSVWSNEFAAIASSANLDDRTGVERS